MIGDKLDITKYSRQNKKNILMQHNMNTYKKLLIIKMSFVWNFIKNKHAGNIELDKIDFKKNVISNFYLRKNEGTKD